jgi:hypothetical protein
METTNGITIIGSASGSMQSMQSPAPETQMQNAVVAVTRNNLASVASVSGLDRGSDHSPDWCVDAIHKLVGEQASNGINSRIDAKA